MEKGERKNVFQVYNKIAHWFSENRDTSLKEKLHLDHLLSKLAANAAVLDLGCGTGIPIMQYVVNQGFAVTGVDASSEILAIAKKNFPSSELILADMRTLNLHQQFDAVIAWHSFFHLPASDQPAMFAKFRELLKPGGILLFTSGAKSGEAWGINGGENLFHASLDLQVYEQLLHSNNFKVLKLTVNDPHCGNDTVWMAELLSK